MKFTQKYQNNYSLKNTLWAIHAPEATSDQCHTTSACVSKNLKISLSLTCCTFFRETYRFESYSHGYLELKIRFINILDMKSSNKEFFYKYKQIIWGDCGNVYFSLRATTAWKVSVFRVILVRIFSHLDWIRRDILYFSVFSPNAGNCGSE